MTATATAPKRPDPPDALSPVGRRWGALAGLVAAGVALGVAQLVSGLIRGARSPVVSVGEVVIDHVPPAVKSFAIATFGTNDKQALIVGTLVLLAVFAAVLGVVAVRHLWVGLAGIAAFGLVGAAAASTRPGHGPLDALPALVGAGTAGVALWALLGPLSHPSDGPPGRPPAAVPTPFDRRRFLFGAVAIGGGAAAAGGVGRLLQRRFEVGAARDALTLPAPASPAVPTPAGADLGVAGITPFVTPDRSFYRVDTAIVAPQVRPGSWQLRLGGMVDRDLVLSFDDLLSRPMIERDVTLVCVSNTVGGDLAGNARWLGVPLADLLREAGVRPGADQLVSRSVDGFTAGTPVSTVLDGRDAMVAVGMNGQPLPVAHGFPARLIVPGLYGYTSATKWLSELELTTFDAYDPYWVKRGWAKVAPIKTMARIDTPRGLARVPAGPVPVGGVAWAPHRGIESVEVRVDDGPWQRARLGEVPDGDTWRQWVHLWDASSAASGRHTLTARATDGSGALQTSTRADPKPDGASGWHSIVVEVR